MKLNAFYKYLLVIFLILVVNILPTGQKLNEFFSYYGFPTMYASDQIIYSSKQFFSFLGKYSELEKRYNEVVNDNSKLHADISYTRMLEEELEAVYSDIGIQDLSGEIITAQVLRSGLKSEKDRMFINQGKKSGVKEGDAVYWGRNFIGLVEMSRDYYSIVRLPNNSSTTLTVTILGENGEKSEALATGNKGGVLLKNIPMNSGLGGGEEVILDDLRVKRFAVLGKVDKIMEDSTQTYKEAFVKTYVDYRDLRFVTVHL